MLSPSSSRSLLNYIGIAVLMLGMGSGELIYWRSLHAAARTSDDDLLLTPETARGYEHAVESQVGTFGLIMVQWSRAVGRLTEPGPLAITICAASIAAAGGCFLAASRLPRRYPPQKKEIGNSAKLKVGKNR